MNAVLHAASNVTPIRKPDYASDATTFLRAIAGDSLVTFQTFDDSGAKRGRLARVLHGINPSNEAHLHKLNANGAGVFFMVNQGDGRGRKTENVQRVRSLFVDLDGAPLSPVLDAPIRPHIAVQSSPERFHAYWLIDGIAASEFTTFQKQLAARFSGDDSVADLPRVMRVPGFWHHKATPYLSHLVHLQPGRVDRDAFVRAFNLDERRIVIPVRQAQGEKVPKGKRNAELFSRARSFVNKGLLPDQVNQRMQAYNAAHCEPPLCATEVDDIAARASAEPAKGTYPTPYWLCDDPMYRTLTDSQFRIAALAFRRGVNGAEFALPWDDYKDIFKHDQRFYKARKAIEQAGIIAVVRESTNTKRGRTTRIYRVKSQ